MKPKLNQSEHQIQHYSQSYSLHYAMSWCRLLWFIGIFAATNIPGRLERRAQKLGITVGNSERAVNALFGVLAQLFDTRLRIFTCDASRKTQFVIPTSKKRCRLAK